LASPSSRVEDRTGRRRRPYRLRSGSGVIMRRRRPDAEAPSGGRACHRRRSHRIGSAASGAGTP
jgi:hypothetical protein